MAFKQIHKVLIGLAILVWITSPVCADLQESRALKIKAAFLVQFSKYITWPAHSFAGPDTPIIIGILGRDPFGSQLDKISRSFKAQKRNTSVRRLRSLSDAEQCHILYISLEESKQIADITTVLFEKPIVLVSDTDGFLDLGGTIQFIIVAGKIRFNISLSGNKKKELEISSKLLKVAHTVQ